MLMMEREKKEINAFVKGKAKVRGKARGPFANDSHNNIKCFRCGDFGYKMRNGPVYLSELEKYAAFIAETPIIGAKSKEE
ncbi:hypothetical protein L1987_08876 [Smallanthus sonchifolius]|uniref:Uncharacterized protein n=1 Tax=Smallanthus sonchifolius TaxID=185202 RepID=A0ACB9JME4_9ASTR|nr:hypothetical protein L1987_08876 [Smallanthus sonchifolius]